MNNQLLKTSGADVLSSRKKTQKNLRGVASNPPPPLLVRPRVKSPGEGRGGEVEEKMFSSLLTPYEDLSHTVL